MEKEITNFSKKFENKKLKTLIISSNKCKKHCNFDNFDEYTKIKNKLYLVENSDRLDILFNYKFGIFNSDYFKQNFVINLSSNKGRLVDILKVHDYNYVIKIKEICNNDFININKIYRYGIFKPI